MRLQTEVAISDRFFSLLDEFTRPIVSLEDRRESIGGGGGVLIELNHFYSHHCALPAIVRAFREIGLSRFRSYIPLADWPTDHPTLEFVGRFYTSMGIESSPIKAVVEPGALELAKKAVNDQIEFFNGSIWNLTNFEFDGLPLGTALVEEILSKHMSAELDQSFETAKLAVASVARYIWWKQFIESHSIDAIVGSHLCYEFALPQLAAIKLGVASYAWTETSLCRSDAHLPLPLGSDCLIEAVGEAWDRLSLGRRERFLELAEVELQGRCHGHRVGALIHDPRHLSLVDFDGQGETLKTGTRPTVLIYCHAFSDAPCALPERRYPYLCSPIASVRRLLHLASSLGLEAYIKAHPRPFPQDELALSELLEGFPSVKRVSSGIRPSDLRGLGVDAVITGWGSISYEASYVGTPVLVYTSLNRSLVESGAVLRFDLDSPESLSAALSQAVRKEFSDDDRRSILLGYVKSSFGALHDITASEMQALSREGDNGRYSPYAYRHWMQSFSHNRYYSLVDALVNFFSSEQKVFSRYCLSGPDSGQMHPADENE